MAELDVFELQNTLKKEIPCRMLKNKKALFFMGSSAFSLISILFTDSNLNRTGAAFVLGAGISLLKNYYRQEKAQNELIIMEKLRATETYQEVTEEYNAYVKEVATLIRSVGLKSAKEAVQYMQFLMEEGFFSYKKQHQYKKYAYEEEYLTELCGARVLSGTSVCRHMSSFLADVLNALDYKAASISAVTTDEDPIKVAKKGIKRWTHAITGISEEGKMYLYDATCGEFLLLPAETSYEEREPIFVRESEQPGIKKNYIINFNSAILNYGRIPELKQITKSSPSRITKEELEYIRNKINVIFLGNIANQYAFYFKTNSDEMTLRKK